MPTSNHASGFDAPDIVEFFGKKMGGVTDEEAAARLAAQSTDAAPAWVQRAVKENEKAEAALRERKTKRPKRTQPKPVRKEVAKSFDDLRNALRKG